MTLSGRYIPGTSLLHRLDPRIKLINYFILIVLIIAARSVWSYLFAAALLLVLVLLSGLPPRTLFGSVSRMGWFFLFIFLMNALFYADVDTLWSWWIFHVSVSGITQGITVVLRLALVIVLSSLLTAATTPLQITAGIELLLKPLRFIRVPVEEVAMIISIAIQFIPVLLEEARMIKLAQIARGARFESRNLLTRARSYIPLVVPLFVASLQRADELSQAMEARGYRNARDRTRRAHARPVRLDWVSLLLASGLLAMQILIR